MEKYGILIGRFQPFHNGHFKIIQQIILDGKTPIIVIGSVNKNDEKNPLSFRQRRKIITNIYPDIDIVAMKDYDCWGKWVEAVTKSLDYFDGEKTFYVYQKEDDFGDFVFNGKTYKNSHYMDVFKDSGFKINDVCKHTCPVGLSIDATKVRKNKEYALGVLDARTLKSLEEVNFWEEK